MAERKAVTRQMARRYQGASKRAKTEVLDELLRLTGWTRRHARRALSEASAAEGPRAPRARRRRPPTYGPELLEPLRFIWSTLNGPAGKRLAPFMAEIVGVLERTEVLVVEEEVRAKLCSMSAATIDRMLAGERQRLRIKGRAGTKPGSILKSQIPIRTYAEWNEAVPGFCEIDLVSHEGSDPSGDFCQTLTLTCVNTGWTEVRAVRNKAQRWCFEALLDIEAALPFPLLGLDSDNGAEFINDQLFRYCAERHITFTRSRPYRKNDNCFVEQKNWPVVRQQVGYARYDTPRELAVLRELYRHLRLYVNFFQPQMRLVSKVRTGARVTKRYDVAQTPYQRVLRSPAVEAARKEALTATYVALNPVELKRAIGRCQDRLVQLSSHKAMRRKGVKPPPGHPFRAEYSWREISRTSFMRQRGVASRTS
jgi:hypothetical protein